MKVMSLIKTEQYMGCGAGEAEFEVRELGPWANALQDNILKLPQNEIITSITQELTSEGTLR
ncbi:MAG TPA: hypothetical protein PK957_04000 [Candidatus Dojkabacteria bacterium]|nr:hypothetical protein [Candidatus Dojkabacteria bacterium]HQF36228.1 hypothetical protein [Candidatus Dojkabacteria bacterium]